MHRHFWNSSSSTTTAGSFNKRHVLQNILCKHLGRDHFDCTVLCILLILHSSTLSWPWLGWMTLQPISYSNWNILKRREGLSILKYLKILQQRENTNRVEICHNRRELRSCKICASCVNFSRKQRTFLWNLLRSARFTLNKYDFRLKLLKFYTLCSVLTKNYLDYWY